MRLRCGLVVLLGLATGCAIKSAGDGASESSESGASTESESDSEGELISDLPTSELLGPWTLLLESGGSFNDKGLDIALTPGGDYVIVGAYGSDGGFMAKISAAGEVLWMAQPEQFADLFDSLRFSQVEIDDLGNIYVVASRPGGNDELSRIIKFDADGTYQWDVEPPNFWSVTCLAVNSDSIYLAGRGLGPFEEELSCHERFTLDGKSQGFSQGDSIECQDAQGIPGGFIIAGAYESRLERLTDDGTDWSIYLSDYVKPSGVAVDADGTIAVVGSNYDDFGQGLTLQAQVSLFEENGVLLWTKAIPGGEEVSAHEVAFTADGDLLVVGDRGNRYALLSRWTREGEMEWLEPMGTVEDKFDHAAVGVVVRDAGNAALVGWWPSDTSENGSDQVWAHGFTP